MKSITMKNKTMIKISPTQSWKASRSAAGSFFFSITFRDFRSLQLTNGSDDESAKKTSNFTTFPHRI